MPAIANASMPQNASAFLQVALPIGSHVATILHADRNLARDGVPTNLLILPGRFTLDLRQRVEYDAKIQEFARTVLINS